VTRLVLDWDGTVTERDTLHMTVEHFGDVSVFERMEGALGTTLTLDEVIEREIETVSAPLDEVVRWLVANVRVRAGFTEIVTTHRPLIVSAGFHELIQPILDRERVKVDVVAHRLDPRPGGWRARFRARPVCAVCDEPCKRSAVAALGSFTYVGDGLSDRCVARQAARVFARAGLARDLQADDVPFEPFTDFVDLASRLSASPDAGS
jgi:2-hydroxy-3-keto-5-methylthiopentenyl-1-phosphate phosphatase